ncbi:MAG: META domain-containing protein, partial [Herpetosiphon sp.]|nr:META domain-containing protein [Herpetosiphon sp.]
STGCNDFTATVNQEGYNLQFTNIVVTKRACPDATVAEQERRILETLGKVQSYEVGSETLILHFPNGAMEFSPKFTPPK